MRYLIPTPTLAFILLALSACTGAGKQQPQAIPAYVGAYEGTVPCADCEGIQYRIQLGEDGRFVSTSLYLGRSPEPFRAEGEYRLDEQGRILLQPGQDEQQYFEPTADGLLWLDRSGQRISGHLEQHYLLRRSASGPSAVPNAATSSASPGTSASPGMEGSPNPAGAASPVVSSGAVQSPIPVSTGLAGRTTAAGLSDAPEGSDLYLRKWQEGVRFYALGNEPFWSLDQQRDGRWVLRSPDHQPLQFDSAEPEIGDDETGIRYKLSGGAGSRLVLTLRPGPCADGMSGAAFDYQIELQLQRSATADPETRRGCGSYSADPRLHNIWAVVALQGQALDQKQYPRGGPNLEINLAMRRLGGFDGCNRLTGLLVSGPQSLQVGAVASTLMACPGDLAGFRLGGLLSEQTLTYRFEDRHLVLEREGGEWLRLVNIE